MTESSSSSSLALTDPGLLQLATPLPFTYISDGLTSTSGNSSADEEEKPKDKKGKKKLDIDAINFDDLDDVDAWLTQMKRVAKHKTPGKVGRSNSLGEEKGPAGKKLKLELDLGSEDEFTPSWPQSGLVSREEPITTDIGGSPNKDSQWEVVSSPEPSDDETDHEFKAKSDHQKMNASKSLADWRKGFNAKETMKSISGNQAPLMQPVGKDPNQFNSDRIPQSFVKTGPISNPTPSAVPLSLPIPVPVPLPPAGTPSDNTTSAPTFPDLLLNLNKTTRELYARIAVALKHNNLESRPSGNPILDKVLTRQLQEKFVCDTAQSLVEAIKVVDDITKLLNVSPPSRSTTSNTNIGINPASDLQRTVTIPQNLAPQGAVPIYSRPFAGWGPNLISPSPQIPDGMHQLHPVGKENQPTPTFQPSIHTVDFKLGATDWERASPFTFLGDIGGIKTEPSTTTTAAQPRSTSTWEPRSERERRIGEKLGFTKLGRKFPPVVHSATASSSSSSSPSSSSSLLSSAADYWKRREEVARREAAAAKGTGAGVRKPSWRPAGGDISRSASGSSTGVGKMGGPSKRGTY